MALLHGGQLQKIAKKYQIPIDDWLDLSTGIAPLSYPIPEIPLQFWQQLPQKYLALEMAARKYYQCESILVSNGSQSIIKALPGLWLKENPHSKKAYLPARGYKEHAKSWEDAGYQCCFYRQRLPKTTLLCKNSVLVIINPNNPTGQLFSSDTIKRYQQALGKLNGLLIIDEAFIDVVSPTCSMCPYVADSHTIILRSFGKFFGLAGIRIGFLVASQDWHNRFSEHLGPWQVNGPAQYIAQKALSDRHWQYQQKQHLEQLRNKQEALIWHVLGKELVVDINGTNLFLTLSFHQEDMAASFYHLLCQQGIYCRLSDEQETLRFGIALEKDIPRLESVLNKIKTNVMLLPY